MKLAVIATVLCALLIAFTAVGSTTVPQQNPDDCYIGVNRNDLGAVHKADACAHDRGMAGVGWILGITFSSIATVFGLIWILWIALEAMDERGREARRRRDGDLRVLWQAIQDEPDEVTREVLQRAYQERHT